MTVLVEERADLEAIRTAPGLCRVPDRVTGVLGNRSSAAMANRPGILDTLAPDRVTHLPKHPSPRPIHGENAV